MIEGDIHLSNPFSIIQNPSSPLPPFLTSPKLNQLVEIPLRQLLRSSPIIRPHTCPDRKSMAQERRPARAWDLALLEIQPGEVGFAVGFAAVVSGCVSDVVAVKRMSRGFWILFKGR